MENIRLPGKKPWERHLRSTHGVSGHHIQALDGEIGHVQDFIIDDETWAIRYLIVDTQTGGREKEFWFHRNGSSVLVGASGKSSSIFPARPSSSRRNTQRNPCQPAITRPDCMDITIGKDIGLMNWWPVSLPVGRNNSLECRHRCRSVPALFATCYAPCYACRRCCCGL